MMDLVKSAADEYNEATRGNAEFDKSPNKWALKHFEAFLTKAKEIFSPSAAGMIGKRGYAAPEKLLAYQKECVDMCVAKD